MPMGSRILEDRTKDLTRVKIFRVVNDELNAQRFSACAHHVDILRMAIFINKERIGF